MPHKCEDCNEKRPTFGLREDNRSMVFVVVLLKKVHKVG